MPAPSSGVKTGRTDLRIARLRLMLVHAPAALHHGGQNFCLLLVSSGKVFARHRIIGLFLEALAAFLDERIDGAEIFAQRSVYIRRAAQRARRLHRSE